MNQRVREDIPDAEFIRSILTTLHSVFSFSVNSIREASRVVQGEVALTGP